MKLRWMLAAALSCALPSIASAEIYGWVDGNGTFTYSNLPPPPEARVTDVIDEPSSAERASSAAKAHEAEVAALNDRIRLLQLEKDRALSLAAQRPSAPVYMPGPEPAAYGCGPDGSYECSAVPAILYGGVWPARYRGGWVNGWRPPLRPGQWPGPATRGNLGGSGAVIAHATR
jgi:hypothetical protein